MSADAHIARSSTFPITIYLSEGSIHGRVEAAVEDLIASIGGQIDERGDPVIGSWFRRMRAMLREVARSPLGREAVTMAAHAVESRVVLAQDANVTATMLQNLGPVVTALQPTKDAVIRVGALLIVKVDWVVAIHQLTAAQQLALDHQPQLATEPREILTALMLGTRNSNTSFGRASADVDSTAEPQSCHEGYSSRVLEDDGDNN